MECLRWETTNESQGEEMTRYQTKEIYLGFDHHLDKNSVAYYIFDTLKHRLLSTYYKTKEAAQAICDKKNEEMAQFAHVKNNQKTIVFSKQSCD